MLVTGASGFLASHVIHQLLHTEEYHVRGTVRDINNEKKTAPLHVLNPEAKYPLELVQADLLEPDSWIRFVATVCDFVLKFYYGMLVYVVIYLSVYLFITTVLVTHFDLQSICLLSFCFPTKERENMP